MNKNLKKFLQCLVVFAIALIVSISSSFNPWVNGTYTQIQEEILDIAQSVRDGFLAYVEVEGHLGPVVYEFYGLGFLAENSQLVHYLMELVVIYVSVMFIYKTAKLYTSEVFSFVIAALVTIIGWGSLTHAGAYLLLFFIMSLSGYHIARQLKSSYLSYHTYLLAIDMALVFFLQPAYSIIWICVLVMLAIKFKVDGVESKEYKTFYVSIFEGILTVFIPMGMYLWYFKNLEGFFNQVVVYNFTNWGSFGAGIQILLLTPWTLALIAGIVAITVKYLSNEKVIDLCCWMGYIVLTLIIVAAQADNLSSTVEIVKVLYVVPLASVFSLLDKPLGLKVEERKY